MQKNHHSEEPAARKPFMHQIKHVGWKQPLASMQVLFPVCLSLFFSSAFRFSLAADAIFPGQSISGQQTLISAGGIFVLGFFSPGNPKNRYLGIWFNKGEPPAVIWVANRENPITDSSPGLVQFNNNGNLVVSDGNQNSSTTLWSTNSSISASSAILLDYGNLVLMDESGRLLWQSFDYPTDTYIPGIKIGTNLETGFNWFLSSWKSSGDPSPGNFTVELDLRGLPRLVIMKGRTRYWSGGPWDGGWSGVPEMGRDYIGNYSFVRNQDEVYYWNLINNSTILFRVVLEPTGVYQILTWSDANGVWIPAWLAPKGPCQFYGTCGAFGVCNVDNFQRCTCLDGFEPRSQQDWDLNDWSGGCARKTGLMCGDGDGFFRLAGMKLPDTSFVEVDEGLGVEECRVKCLGNCSCTAYANFGASGNGSGCAIWNGDLIDVQKFLNGGEEFYLRVASSELGPGTTNKTISLEASKRKTLVIAIAIPLSGLLLLVAGCSYFIWKKMNLRVLAFKFSPSISSFIGGEDGKKSLDYRRFKFGIIEAATNNFSHTNKLGEGGFGPVYKGKLPNGQEIAVKRLSKSSGQGISEFHTELLLTAKLQHRNLVRLLGYCTQGEEKILIYEYMPNKGLDSFLFDQDKSKLLDWKKRLNIITGIARGMLYLHEDSRLRVIHRDLKSSNILLDAEMSPKISDFGMARSFGRNQTQANTRKVVGTYGYMSPEYAVRGVFSEKSDIFSFGILILEIVSGKKINDFCHSDDYLSLTGYGWKLWKEGRGLEFMDPSLGDSCHTWEVIRCIHIGLLCVQESPRDRPNISFIVSMLGSEIDLPLPKKPAFSTVTEIDPTSTHLKSYSTNNVTITAIQGR